MGDEVKSHAHAGFLTPPVIQLVRSIVFNYITVHFGDYAGIDN